MIAGLSSGTQWMNSSVQATTIIAPLAEGVARILCRSSGRSRGNGDLRRSHPVILLLRITLTTEKSARNTVSTSSINMNESIMSSC
jgi:hypothetical protein